MSNYWDSYLQPPAVNSTPVACVLSDQGNALVTLYVTFSLALISTITNPIIEAFAIGITVWAPIVRGIGGIVVYAIDMVDHVHHFLFPAIQRHDQLVPTTIDVIEAPPPEYQSTAEPKEYGQTVEQTFEPEQKPWGDTRFVYRRKLITFYEGKKPGILSHIVWWIWHVYTPYSQWTWFAMHLGTGSFGTFGARATAVSVVLVSGSIDLKSRVIRDTADRAGPLVGIAMCILSLLLRISLLVLALLELVFAVKQEDPSVYRWFIPGYFAISAAWAFLSFKAARGRDAQVPRPKATSKLSYLFSLSAGFQAACAASAPSLIAYCVANSDNGLGVGDFASCEGASLWSKFEQLVL